MIKKWLICTFLIIYSFAFGYSEQVVVSQFEIGLKNSSTNSNYKYSLTGITKSSDEISAVNSTYLDDTIDFNGSIGGVFTGTTDNLKFNYSTAEKSIIIPVNKNTSTTTTSGSFQLTETATISGENATNYLIQDNYVLPAKVITLSQDTSVNTGVKFTYDESGAKYSHLSAYKMQNYMIRVSRAVVSDTNYDVLGKLNGKKLVNTINSLTTTSYAQSFIEGNTGYMDFLVTGDKYDKEQSISTKVGISLKFMPGNIEVFGLPKGSYRVELYSFRYSKEITNKGNVVITKEDFKAFTIGDEFVADGIDIFSFSSASFKTIKATILTVGSTTNPAITIKEALGAGAAATIIGSSITATSGAIYLDNTTTGALTISAGGTSHSGKYYQLWDITYTTPNIAVDTTKRTVTYILNGDKTATTTYSIVSSTTQYTEPLYQTVFAGFKDNAFSVGTFEIDDKIMTKYSNGYRNVRSASVPLITSTSSTSIDIETLYKGVTGTDMGLNSSYNWTGSTLGNSIIISKVISDSKGVFQNINDSSKNYTFYTTGWTPNLRFYETADENNEDDTIRFKWNAPNKSSYNVTADEDKVIFRILKSTSDTEVYRYKPENNGNPIIASTSSNLTSFLNGTNSVNYFDIMFTSGEDNRTSIGNTVFSFTKDNTLQIIGLDVGEYKLQVYSLQNEDTTAKQDSAYDYRVLTYGGTLTGIKMGLPELEKEEYGNIENPYIIDSINVKTKPDKTKEVEVGLVIKADQQIKSLTKNNLVARKDEEVTGSAFYYTTSGALLVEAWKPNYTTSSGAVYTDVKKVDPTVIDILKADKADFQYPLDIVFLIDNSGSMQNEIDAVELGLTAFSKDLVERGYNINYNVITFGGSTTKLEDAKWYTDVAGVVKKFETLSAGGGYSLKQENGSVAIDRGISVLRAGGRFLNKNLGIWQTTDGADQKYLPSKKWIIFLTDENMDKDGLPTGYSNVRTDDTFVVKKLATNLSATNNGYQDNISLTGIFHLNTLMTELDSKSDNNDDLPSAYSDATFQSSLISGIANEGAKEVTTHSNGYIGNGDKSNPKGYIGNVSPISDSTVKAPLIGPYVALKITDKLSHMGVFPSDSKDIFYTEFARYGLGSLFSMYEMGETGEWVSTALAKSVEDIGIIQRWIIKYTSPYGEEDSEKKGGSDGELREVIFSIDGVRNYKDNGYIKLTPAISKLKVDSSGKVTSPRIYTAPITKIDAYFISPDETAKKLEKQNDGITLKAKAQSQYKKEINGVTQWVNYPITKGTFIITGIKSNDGVTNLGVPDPMIVTSDDKSSSRVVLSDQIENNSTWYYGTAALNSKEFTAKFGNNPKDLVIKFIAETAEESKSISLSGLTVVDKTNPKIIGLKIVNKTLEDFMEMMKNDANNDLFLPSEIEGATKITQIATADEIEKNGISSFDKKLNIKDQDIVEVEFDIDDENITKDSKGVTIIYNGHTYDASNVVEPTYDGTTKTKWKVTLSSDTKGPYEASITNLEFNISDDSSSPNNLSVKGEIFNEPSLLSNTFLAERSVNPAGAEYTNYYNNGLISVSDKSSEALGYLMVFDQDTSYADVDAATKSYLQLGSTTTKWSVNKTGDFSFADSKYNYDGVVYIINKAGAIMGITHNKDGSSPSKIVSLSSVNTQDEVLNAIYGISRADNPSVASPEKRHDFYVDTIAPKAESFIFEKTADINFTGSSYKDTEAKKIFLGENKPYKSGDTIKISGTIKEVNLVKVLFEKEIFVDGSLGTLSGESYVKIGAALDYNGSSYAKDETGLGITVSDKAGNSVTVDNKTGDSLKLSIIYDDRKPSLVSTIAKITGNGNKYTDNASLPLKNEGTVPISFVESQSAYAGVFGDVSTLSNGTLNYPVLENVKNMLKLKSYSSSGMASDDFSDDSIVLDTAINDTSNIIYETTVKTVGGKYEVDLNKAFSTIEELVGLSEFTISSSEATYLTVTSASGGAHGGYQLTGAPYNIVAETYNFTTNNKLQFNNSTKGNIPFTLVVYDRLGNTRSYSYMVQIPNNVVIIGKTTGESKQIITKIDGTGKVRITSRKE